MKVSVIIPVYNAESSITRCLDSVLAQTLDEIEIICVDDGSTDGSAAVLLAYAKKNIRIKVIRQKNSGAMSARKEALKYARGEYVGFVDCDDWIDPGMYQSLLSIAEKTSADMVTSAYTIEGNYRSIQPDSVPSGTYTEENINTLRENALLDLRNNDLGISASMCTKLFRRGLIQEVIERIPDSLVFSEDKMCVYTFLLEAKRVVITKEAYYHYVMNPHSVTHKPDMDYLEHVNDVYKYLMSLYERDDFTPGMRIQAELYVTQMLLKGINTRMGFSFRNLLWIDPYWMEKVPKGSLVALYGGGDLGRKYYEQLCASKSLRFAGCVDYGYERMHDDRFEIVSPEALADMQYDCVVITIKNLEKAEETRRQLISDGIPPEKILWFKQEEIFWKYAEAMGLLDD
ncbi:MAG: glycosyltransferase [Lachnospiraceae bacterium]|nr:glycosyltransferase [Lachnospiraceae bacterium]